MDIWTEKYRAIKLNDVVNQKHVIDRLKAWVKDKSIPNMLFAGSAGVGKTTVALALARELFGEGWRQNFLELNASDERGIQVVRENIKNFASTMPMGAAFKIVFLDEADALTPEAQQALRRTMERFSSSSRFILSCNFSSRLIDPIQSRTAVFRFKRLGEADVKEYMERIIKGEGLKSDAEGLRAIYEISEGDLRKATNLLQAASAIGIVSRDNVYGAASQAKPRDISEMVSLSINGDFSGARKKLYDLTITQGISGDDIIRSIHREVLKIDLPEKTKLELIEKIGEYEFRLNMGSSEEIQLQALLAQFIKAKS
jgi:replication factor C small subunit